MSGFHDQHGNSKRGANVEPPNNVLRYSAGVLLVLLFISDFINPELLGFKIWTRDMGSLPYWVLGVLVVGIERASMRELFMASLKKFVGVQNEKPERKDDL